MTRHAALYAEMTEARKQTDNLFAILAPGALYSRPVAERHRLLFYLGHFEAFDWNLVAQGSSPHPTFDKLFERGIDPEPGQAPSDKESDWPRAEEVRAYGAGIREWIDRNFYSLDPALLQMAIEHRQMHAETFAYLLHNLPADQKLPLSEATGPNRAAPAERMIDIAGGDVTLGQSDDRFGWDNEHKAIGLPVPDFSISKFKVTNGAWLEFVKQGGPIPHFWSGDRLRTMFGETPMPLDHPVWVTHEQASAYAQWRGLALPGEAQYQRAAALTTPDAARDNFGFHRWGTVPVDSGHERSNGHAPVQMAGNGWEWTRDVFSPFPGFAPHPRYPGYSADFFDGRHYVMKGASPRTAALLTRPSFRNWFRPEYPHMYAGFRLVNG